MKKIFSNAPGPDYGPEPGRLRLRQWHRRYPDQRHHCRDRYYGPVADSTADTETDAETSDSTGERDHFLRAWRTAWLTVGMECQYAPYNWTQLDDSNGAVPIANNPGSYANGYDVMMAKRICEAYGWELEVMAPGLGRPESRPVRRHH